MTRRNPPADVDSPNVLGGECAVWALAAATGRSVPEVRRAYLDAGVDIWTKNGEAVGTHMGDLRKVMQRLDVERRIFSIGYAGMFTTGSGTAMTAVGRGAWGKFLTAEDGNVSPDFQFDSTESRTVGNLVRVARKHGFAMIGMTNSVKTRRVHVRASFSKAAARSIEAGYRPVVVKFSGHTHMVGYSPKMGFYDTARENKSTRKAYEVEVWDPKRDFGVPIRPRTGLEWSSHGESVPSPRRQAAFWIFFKGE